jgi:hypothetical protein
MIRLLMTLTMCLAQFFVVCSSDESNEWTWLHRKTFNDSLRAANVSKKSLVFTDDAITPFTQLIFSWNALRPEKGHFSFFAQVRDAATKKWGEWHTMADWGAGVQRSYMSKGDGFSSYAHVRLEIENKKSADGFRIKVEPRENAHLGLLYGLSVTTSHFDLFKSESAHEVGQKMKTVILSGVPKIAQFALEHEDNHRICSPVSCAMVVQYLTGEVKDPLDFASGVFDAGLSVYGSWACNVAHAFDVCRGSAYFCVKRCNSFLDIHKQLVRGIPSVVSVRGTLPGALKPFSQGHLMVVIGWDGVTREVLCHDPAADEHHMVIKRYPLEDFLRAWERSHRLTYAIEPVVINRIK